LEGGVLRKFFFVNNLLHKDLYGFVLQPATGDAASVQEIRDGRMRYNMTSIPNTVLVWEKGETISVVNSSFQKWNPMACVALG
jgi:hypothetical protein